MRKFNSTVLDFDPIKLINKELLNKSDVLSIVKDLKECPNCNNRINPDLNNSLSLDEVETVVWDGRLNNSDFHTCSNCQTTICISVSKDINAKEWGKMWGTGERIWIEMDSKYISVDESDISAKQFD